MSAYHVMAAHFPIAIWMTTFLFIVLRSFSLPGRGDKLQYAISLLLFIGVLAGLATYSLGWMVWSWEALTYSPLARNHILMASWSLAYWTLLWVLHWRLGEHLWHGMQRWTMLMLSMVGISLLSVTGTLGGSLTGNPSGLPDILASLGWDTNSTFYLPPVMIGVTIASGGVILAMAWLGQRSKA
ncbi:MAG: heme ABC transporter permease [Gammaproteobacteria bacterium]|nr:heme ABC transporter permease [Gammaproteobacteria bacterium]